MFNVNFDCNFVFGVDKTNNIYINCNILYVNSPADKHGGTHYLWSVSFQPRSGLPALQRVSVSIAILVDKARTVWSRSTVHHWPDWSIDIHHPKREKCSSSKLFLNVSRPHNKFAFAVKPLVHPQTNRKDCQRAPSWPFKLQLFAQPFSICLYQILLYRDYTTFPKWPSF